MVLNQHSNFQKAIASAKHTIKFDHKHQHMPYLPPGIHSIATPVAIEHVRQQDLLFQKHQKAGYYPPCTGAFERIFGLPCYHTIRRCQDWGETLLMSYFDDDHWRYRRQEGSIPLRPY